MSFKKNVIASYASQIYVALIGIVMAPIYIKYMGAEAYGLIGFFMMLQAWFQLLDMGLTPTITRETSRFRAGAIDALSLRRLLRALEGIFFGTASLGAIFLLGGSTWIATHWLNAHKLQTAQIEQAIALMALIVAIRWASGLYRGAISGFEHLVWLSGFNALVATFRFVLVIPLFVYIGARPIHFFTFQLLVASAELVALVARTYKVLPAPRVPTHESITPWDWKPLRGTLKFSLTIAFTGFAWVLATQTDKLILTKLLPLADYAYFTLAVLIASGVTLLNGPVSSALLPRMTCLSAEGKERDLLQLYRTSTQLIAVISFPTAISIALFAEKLLEFWTGDPEIATRAGPVLRLYALGNGVLSVAAFPYYLQFAKGDLRLHLLGNLLFIALLVPAVFLATLQFGVIGAGYAWVAVNVIYFLLWTPLVHNRFAPGLHLKWLQEDVSYVLGMASSAALVGYVLISYEFGWPTDRALEILTIAVVSFSSLLLALSGSRGARSLLRESIRKKSARKAG